MRTTWVVGSGIDTYLSALGKLHTMAPEHCGKAIYEGAKIVADEVKRSINSLPESKTKNYRGTNKVRGVTPSQKKGLQEGFGISHAQTEGSYRNVKLGFDGYNSTKTKKYPKGQPNALIARVVESGSQYHTKTPYINPAVQRTKGAAEQKMASVIDEQINTIMR